MSLVGYARVSTTDQSLDVQLEQLREAGCEKIFSEQRSASNHDRPALLECLSWVREGDVLIVCKLDRMARSIVHLHKILDELDTKSVGFRCLNQPVDTTTSIGRLLINILGTVAEFELDMLRERQAEGIRKARAAGVYGKSTCKVTAAQIEEKKNEGMGVKACAKALGIGVGTVYRIAPDLKWGAPPAVFRKPTEGATP